MFERHMLARWRRAAALAAGGAIGAFLCVAIVLRALTRQLGRLEGSEASLGARNQQFEATRRRVGAQGGELAASQVRLAEKSAAGDDAREH